MKAVVQRVSRASVRVKGSYQRSIGRGCVILLGVKEDDTPSDAQWLAGKIASMRIFEDEERKMNCSLIDINGEALVVSQFTLIADVRKGNRPSFGQAAIPEKAIPLYELFVDHLSKKLEKNVPTGEFGASMQVEIINEGPVTIVIEGRKKA